MTTEQIGSARSKTLMPIDRLQRLIVVFRGEKVMVDRGLAELYGVEVRVMKSDPRRKKL